MPLLHFFSGNQQARKFRRRHRVTEQESLADVALLLLKKRQAFKRRRE
jgi:hypothetical protein